MNRKWILMAGIVFVSAGAGAMISRAEDSSGAIFIEQKIALERVLEAKGQRALDAILGPRQSRLTVVVSINPSGLENVEMVPNKKGEVNFLWRDPKSNDPVLPGFQSNQGGAPVASSGGRYSRSFSLMAQFIKRISATVVVVQDVTEADADAAKEAMFNVLGLEVERGDAIQLIRARTSRLEKPSWKDPLELTGTLALSALGLLVLLILWIILRLVRASDPREAAVRHTVSVSAPNAAEDAEEPEEEKPEGGKAPGTVDVDLGAPLPEPVEPPVTEENVFARLGLEDARAVSVYMEGVTPEVAAALLSAIRPETAAEALGLASPALRESALKALGKNFNVHEEDKKRLAGPLAEFVRSFVHGPKALLDIYENSADDIRRRIADSLKKSDPPLLAYLEAESLRLEHLFSLPDAQWVTVCAGLGAEALAAILYEAGEEARQRLTASLPKDLAALVNEHLQLGGRPNPSRVAKAQREVFAAARALRRAGKIMRADVSSVATKG